MRNYLLLLVLVGCTSSSDESENTLDLKSSPYTLQPGEEKYFCYTARLPKDRDVAIKRITPTYGKGTHHILTVQTIAPEPEGFSECPVLIRQTWIPLYTGGLDSGPLEAPEGIAFKTFEPGQQILMQLHLQNATDAPITASTSMKIEYVDATPDLMPATVFGLDNHKINVPPGGQATSEMSCLLNKDLAVFAVMGHMHKQGVHLDVSRGPTAGAEMLYEEDWKFEEQPITPLTMSVKKGDNLHLRCTHKNTGTTPLLYGESSDTEMCSFVMYYAPADRLDGCINE
jgi:hypothetical protein